MSADLYLPFYIAEIILASMTLTLMMLAFYKVNKFLRHVQEDHFAFYTNRLITGVIVFLCLFNATTVALSIINLYDFDKDEISLDYPGVIAITAPTFLFIAVYLNLRIWINHYLMIRETVAF